MTAPDEMVNLSHGSGAAFGLPNQPRLRRFDGATAWGRRYRPDCIQPTDAGEKHSQGPNTNRLFENNVNHFNHLPGKNTMRPPTRNKAFPPFNNRTPNAEQLEKEVAGI